MVQAVPSRAIRVYHPLALLLLTVAVYCNTLPQPFLPSDRAALFLNPNVVDKPDWSAIWLAAPRTGATAGDLSAQPYEPVTQTSYRLNYTLARQQLRPAPFRIVNILLLGMIGCLSALWMRSFISSATAWIMAALIVAHPVNSQLVHVVAGRSILLAMAGLLATLWIQRRAIVRGRWRWFEIPAIVLSAVVALGSSPTGLIVLPMAMIQGLLGPTPGKLDLPWVRKSNPDEPPCRLCPSVHVVVAVVLALGTIGYTLARVRSGHGWFGSIPANLADHDLTSNPLWWVTPSQRLPAALALAWEYTRSIIAPRPFFCSVPTSLPIWASPSALLGTAIVLASLAALVVTLRRRSWTSLALVLGLGQYLIVGSLITPAEDYHTNRLALPFVVALAVLLAGAVNHYVSTSARQRAVALIPAGLLVALMAVSVVLRSDRYNNPLSLRAADADRQPGNAAALFLYGQELAESDRPELALAHIERAVELRPDSAQARLTLANLLMVLGRPDAAVNEYLNVTGRHPGNLAARVQLASLYLQQQNIEKAREQLDAARLLAPLSADVLHVWARLDAQQGNFSAAIAVYRRILQLQPHDTTARMELDRLSRELAATQP